MEPAAAPTGGHVVTDAAAPITTGIPKILHQTYATKLLPEAFQKRVDHLRRLNPDWEHRLYDDADIEQFIRSTYGDEMLGVYNSIARQYGAARADLFRYLVIYHTGGVYLDIKSSASRPFDDVFRPDDTFILAQWDNEPGQEHEGWGRHDYLPQMLEHGEFVQWFIAGAPGHPMMRAVIDRVVGILRSYNPLRHGVGQRVVAVTGPIPYTDAIAALLDRCDYRRLRDYRELGLQYSLVGGGMEHRQVAKTRHYTRTRQPIVNQPRSPLMKLLIRVALDAKALRRWVLGLG